MGDLVGAWWNGRWRRPRRDIHLKHRPERWVVETRQGGPEGESRSWEYDSEAEARAMVDRCITAGGDGWREITKAYQSQREMRKNRVELEPGDQPT